MKYFYWLVAQWWRFIFWWKHRCGFVDLGRTITITGTVVSMEDTNKQDGDRTFNVKPDSGYEWCITGVGGILTTEDDKYPATLHCEIVPWKPIDIDLHVGDKVRVTGRWGLDGCHLGKGWAWDVFMGIIGHGPNMSASGTYWMEIHAVDSVGIISSEKPF